MDYEKKYKDALERAKEFYILCKKCGAKDTVDFLEDTFPELKESEDEKSKNWILEYLYDGLRKSDEQFKDQFKAAIAWLEKQGEQKSVISDDALREGIAHFGITQYQIDNWLKKYVDVEKQGERKQHLELKAGHWYFCHQAYCCRADHLTVKEGERFMCEEDGVVKGFVIKNPEKYFKEVCAPAPIDDEQKPFDNVKPKFKVKKGEWYVCTETFVLRGNIIAIKGQTYQSLQDDTITCEDNCLFIDRHDGKASDYFRLWTIQDAKDGDVLVFDDIIMIFKSIKTTCTANTYILYCNRIVVDDWCDFGNNAHPATKEQRDLLFSKMKETSYEWDAENKELKRIEQKPDWSEEMTKDEIIAELWDLLDSIDTYADLQINGSETDKCFSWIENKTQERHKLVKSDGYDLFIGNKKITKQKK